VHEHAGSSAGFRPNLPSPSSHVPSPFHMCHLARQKTIAITALVTCKCRMERLPVPRTAACQG
jgi:hypothetical protein